MVKWIGRGVCINGILVYCLSRRREGKFIVVVVIQAIVGIVVTKLLTQVPLILPGIISSLFDPVAVYRLLVVFLGYLLANELRRVLITGDPSENFRLLYSGIFLSLQTSLALCESLQCSLLYLMLLSKCEEIFPVLVL